jgi:hypothetical protein
MSHPEAALDWDALHEVYSLGFRQAMEMSADWPREKILAVLPNWMGLACGPQRNRPSNLTISYAWGAIDAFTQLLLERDGLAPVELPQGLR